MVYSIYYRGQNMTMTTYNRTPKKPSLEYILKKISDHETLTLFETIALLNEDRGSEHLKGTNMTDKQYYSRISRLTDSGLIKRHKGKYSLTLLGKIVYDTNMTINQALNYYWKLKAIESIHTSSSTSLAKEELSNLIDSLIDNRQIKDILVKKIHILEDESKISISTSKSNSLLSATELKRETDIGKVELTD
jgi:predicted transcriptional regulator